ncbi:MAG: hypothetical protein JSR82_06945 [Verrucomicrobia bacterium]|nr:hypothetical protein [Verrucomicrobiota bacterium]
MPPFVSRVFWTAAIYGLVLIPPQFFLEAKTGRDFPPAITHPEFYYSFLGVALAWQFAFVLIARDPIRYRPMMIPGLLEKVGFGLSGVILFCLGRAAWLPLAAGIIDLVFASLMFVAYTKTPPRG